MRISDWSSDVCSSDLPADQERQQAEAAERDRQLAELKAARESGVLVQGRQGSGGGDAVSVTAAPSAPTDQATAPKLALDATNDPNAQGRKADFVANLDPRGDVNPHALTPPPSPYTLSARSEEHTSELQSLMRISYAVLCL